MSIYDSAEALIRSSDLVVFATVAAEPHVGEVSWFAHNPVVLHVSLRDLAPEILLASTNVVDDVEHCLKADTSPHLVEQLTGSRDFLAGIGGCDGWPGGGAGGSAGGVSPFGLGCWIWRSASMSMTRWPLLGSCMSSMTSSTSSAATAEH